VDTTKALQARGVLNLELPSAQEARSIMRFDMAHGLKTSMSIGYKTIVDQVKDGARYLKEIRLFEGSLVGIGMNNQANVTAAKNLEDAQYHAQIADLIKQLRESYKWFPSGRGSAGR
jgi:phage head maturation protease